MGVFELYRDDDAKFRFRIRDDTGCLVAVSEAHEDKDSAIAAVGLARDCAVSSGVVDLCGAQAEDLPAGEGGYFLG